MKNILIELKNKSAIEQRNIAIIGMVLMGVSLIVSLFGYVLSSKTTIIIPSRISGEYSINDDGSSNITYLEDMGISTAYNFLNISKSNFEFSKNQILKITAPNKVKMIEKLLLETHKIIINRDISTVFKIEYIKVQPSKNSVKIYGSLNSFIGTQKANEENKGYLVLFDYKGATLFLKSFKEIKYLKQGEKINEKN